MAIASNLLSPLSIEGAKSGFDGPWAFCAGGARPSRERAADGGGVYILTRPGNPTCVPTAKLADAPAPQYFVFFPTYI